MKQLLDGIATDLLAYDDLLTLLDGQFDAALRHQSTRLGEIAARISTLVDALEARRQERVALATQLLGPAAAMTQVFGLLKAEPRVRLEQDWRALERMVIECKRLGKRNSDLLVEQYTIMQRVLHGEDCTYEPA